MEVGTGEMANCWRNRGEIGDVEKEIMVMVWGAGEMANKLIVMWSPEESAQMEDEKDTSATNTSVSAGTVYYRAGEPQFS